MRSGFREGRRLRGKRLEQTVEVCAYEPGGRFAIRGVDRPLPADGDLRPASDGNGGTRLHIEAPGA